MGDPIELVNKLLEGVDDNVDAPEPYLDWLGQKVDTGPLKDIRFGAYIHLSDEETIRENASEHGIDVDNPAFWEEVERCMAIMESNCLQLLRESGLHVSDEGHDESARVASVWIDTEEEDRRLALLKAVINWSEGDWPSTTSGTMDYAFGANTTQRIYQTTEDAARFIDVTIEFAGTDALVEWSKLNLNEAVKGNPDDPDVFLRHYVPRMQGRLMIEFNAIKPHFPDAPANWYRENVDATLMFRYNKPEYMRSLMQHAYTYNRTREDRAGIEQVTYRFRFENPQGHSLCRRFLDEAGCSPATLQWVCETNAPIWFYVSVKEFNSYMKMVYPQVKLKEALGQVTYEETDADELEKTGVVFHFGDNAWGDCARHGDPYLIKLDGKPVGWFQLTDQNELNAIEILPEYQQQGIGTEIVRQLYGDQPDPSALTSTPASKAGAKLLKRFGIDAEVYEADEEADPKAYLDAVTGWIDTFMRAGMTHDDSAGHEGQWWIKWRMAGNHYWIIVSTRKPYWMQVLANDALYGTNRFQRTFEFKTDVKDTDQKALVAWFQRVYRLINDTVRHERDQDYTVGERLQKRIEAYYEDFKKAEDRRRMTGEALDDPEMQRYVDKVVSEPCFHCNTDLNRPGSVVRTYVGRDGTTQTLPGHYDAVGYYESDDTPPDSFWEWVTHADLPEDCDTCAACGKSTLNPNRNLRQEGVDEPEQYLHNIYDWETIREKLENYGLSFYPNEFQPWGRWVVIKGFAYWAVYSKDPEKYLPQSFFREQLEKFCKDMGFTVYKIQTFNEPPVPVEFKLAIPKIQVDVSSWEQAQRMLDDPDFRERRQVHDLINRDWLPESAEADDVDDPKADALRLMANAPMRYNELRQWTPYIHVPRGSWANPEDYYFTVFIVPVFTNTGRLSKANSYRGWLRMKQFTNENPPTWEQRVAAVNAVVPDQLPGFYASKLKKQGYQVGMAWEPYEDKFYDNLIEALDPDDPGANIERHSAALDIQGIMQRLGFEDMSAKSNFEHWGKTIGNIQWRVSASSTPFVYLVERLERPAEKVQVGRGRRWGQWSIVNQFTCHVTELEQQLREEGALHEAFNPDDPDVNVGRHMASMDIDAIMQRLGFSERKPTWNCADPEYRWFEKFVRGLKWTVIRASDDTPQIFDVAVYRPGKVQTSSGPLIDYNQIGALKCHVGELETRLATALQGRVQENGVPLPPEDDPANALEQHAQRVEQGEKDALDSIINMAVEDFETRVRLQGVVNWKRADQLAAEVGDQWAATGNYANGSDEYDWVVSAVNNRASEMFPSAPVEEAVDDPSPESYIRKLPIPVKATISGERDGVRQDQEFDAEPYFDYLAREGDIEAMLELAKCDFHSDYPADLVGQFFSDGVLEDFFRDNLESGFEVYVDFDDIRRWVEHNKPEWYPMLWPGDMPIKEAADPDDPSAFIQHMETDWRKILTQYGWKVQPHTERTSFSLEYPDRVWGEGWPMRIYAHHGWGPEPEFDYIHPDPDNPNIDAEDEAYEVWLRDHPVGRRDINFPDYIAFQFGREHYRRIEVPLNKLASFCSRFVQGAKKVVGTETVASVHQGRGLDTMLYEVGQQVARELQIPLKESVDAPPEDEPTDVIKQHEKGLLLPEMERLGFTFRRERGVETIYGDEIPRWWYKTYEAPDQSRHALNIYFWGGQTPEVQANVYDGQNNQWFKHGEDHSPKSPAQNQAHLSAIVRDLDAAMQRNAPLNLPPPQEFEAIKRVIAHHSQWWEDTLDYLVNQGGIRGQIGPGQPA